MFPQLLWPLGIPLAAPWQPFGTPETPLGSQGFSYRLRKQSRAPPDLHFGALACMPCVFSLFAPARFPTILDHFWDPKVKLLGPTTIPRDSFGTHNHPPGPSFGTPSPPLHPLASYWGPFDTPPGSGESLPGPSWDPLGPLRTTPGIPRLHLGPSGCPSWQPLVFLFGTGAGGRGGACKSAAAVLPTTGVSDHSVPPLFGRSSSGKPPPKPPPYWPPKIVPSGICTPPIRKPSF